MSEDNHKMYEKYYDRVNARRNAWITDIPVAHTFRYENRLTNRGLILKWVHQNSSGEFYLGGNIIGFKDEQDAVMYRLSHNV